MQDFMVPSWYQKTLLLLTRKNHCRLPFTKQIAIITLGYQSIQTQKPTILTERKTNAHRPQGKTVEKRQITIICTVKYEAHEHHPMTGALVGGVVRN